VQKDCGKPQSITIRIASFHTELQITKQDSWPRLPAVPWAIQEVSLYEAVGGRTERKINADSARLVFVLCVTLV
jgi:hypothetical protein